MIERQIDHPLRLLVAAAFGPIAQRIGIIDYRRFVRFLDSESIQNVKQVTRELNRAIKSDRLGDWSVDARERILTPLVMDFDLNGKVEKFEAQLSRLIAAASSHGAVPRNANVKVLPFVGLDPRRIVFKNRKGGELCVREVIRSRVDAYLEDHGVKLAIERRKRANLKSGDVIGLKLYPPLGFNVYPRNPGEREAYLDLYERLAELEIPITVHCQEGSFDLTDGQVKLFTRPENWARVMKSRPGLRRLRINFGHFGGERGVAEAINWKETEEDDLFDDTVISHRAEGVSERGWTHGIVQLLKRYEHTYADISAFDFGNSRAVASLLWLLAYDRQGNLDADDAECHNYPIAQKLLWGSDYPMILDKNCKNYSQYFSHFINTLIDRHEIRAAEEYPIPAEGKLPSSSALLKALVGTNPVRFLFG
ncbi:MAG: amidohydrolase family protein [bacterium]|nr:amidohydrolase family protein [bacterium]